MDIELLEKFLQGRCTEEEALVVKVALEKDPAVLEAYLREAALEATAGGAEEGALDGIGVNVGMPVEMERALLVSLGRKKEGRVVKWWPAAAAAAVVGIVVTGWLGGLFGAEREYVSFEATAMVRQVRLADGSVVWLRPGSRVRFDQKTFGGKERLIEVEKGEVFFDVVHNAKSPFIVQTGKVQTADIGTSFDINRGGANVVVTVASGEVKVSHEQKELGHILPGNQMSVASTGEFTSRVLPGWMASIWKENHLQLKNVSFSELAMAIQQLYGIRLQTTEEHINRQTFTMQLNRQTPGEQVIKVICLFNQNQYRKMADGSYLIY